jgi:hypothetical protein
MVDHYAEAFSVEGDGCFRMVGEPERPDHAMHCPEPVTLTGRFHAPNGMVYQVRSCDGHAHDLVTRHQIGGARPQR